MLQSAARFKVIFKGYSVKIKRRPVKKNLPEGTSRRLLLQREKWKRRQGMYPVHNYTFFRKTLGKTGLFFALLHDILQTSKFSPLFIISSSDQ